MPARLGLNQHYCGLIARARGDDASWMRGQLQEARWLIKSLESRAETLLKVADAIVRRQSAFLDYGPEAMHPLVLREVAEEVGMHESTISRVTTRKYIHTPRGTFELKYFFSSGVSTEDGGSASATAIQAMLRKLIDAEDRASRYPTRRSPRNFTQGHSGGPPYRRQIPGNSAHSQFQRTPACQLNNLLPTRKIVWELGTKRQSVPIQE
jgi:hypothetical protein